MDHKIEKALKRVIDMYTKLEDDLLKTIAKHFRLEDEFQNSDYWRVKKLQEMGLFNQETIKIIAEDTGATEEEIIKAFEQIGIDTKNIPTLEEAYKNGKLKIDPKYIKDNPVLDQIVKRAEANANATLLELNSRILKETKKAYLKVLEEAYLKTTSGTHSYTEAITEALGTLGDEGITTLTYQVLDDSGDVIGVRNYSIESAVRRDVLTEARNLNHEMTEELVKELEPEYLYLSEHLNCREQHFPWQGTIIKANELVDITDYGDVAGLGGINCRHYFEPYWGEARGDELKHFNQTECEIQYQKEQQQRYLERGLRKWKRKAEIYKANGDIEEYNKCQTKVKEWASRLQQYTQGNNLQRDFTRENVYMVENKEFEAEAKEYFKKQIVGKFDISKYTDEIKTTTKDVVLLKDRMDHILKEHSDAVKGLETIKEFLESPEHVYKELSKKDTLWLIKHINGTRYRLTLKINTPQNMKEIGYKNSIIQFQVYKHSNIDGLLDKKRIVELVKK